MADIIVAGINGELIPPHIQEHIEDRSGKICSSTAHLELIAKNDPGFDRERWIPIVPLQECFSAVADCIDENTILFIISGDPLFYGIGRMLTRHFSNSDIWYIPAVSYMQSCFASIGLNWDDADFLSLHGRPLNLLDASLNSRKLFIYTDPDNTPDTIASYLKSRIELHHEYYTVHVAERIGSPQQRLVSGSLGEIAAMSFEQPNSMIVLDNSERARKSSPKFGLDEKDIVHSRGLITKNEVRAAVIHRLQLEGTGILWDIGAGSGSISLEASRLFGVLSVYAIERNPEQLENIRANKVEYECKNLHIVKGQAPEILHDLPNPDRIFIGGSGGRIETIIDYLSEQIKGPLRVVATAVLETTARTVPEKLYQHGFDVEISTIETSRLHYPSEQKTTFNPISIICGTRS